MSNFNIKSRNVFGYYYRGELSDKEIKKKHKEEISKIRRNLIKEDTSRQTKEYMKQVGTK